jgi:hypothetical protein
MLTGDALGRAMVELKGGKVEYPDGKMDESISFVASMSPPSGDELKKLKPAIAPIIMNDIIPDFVANAIGVPAYRRHGGPIDLILRNQTPKNDPKNALNSNLRNQLDKIINYYEIAGTDQYSWKTWGPEMQTAEWQYFSFEPKEPAPTKGTLSRYRPVALPQGMENWFAADFDATKAGWKTGKAPFGQNKGEQKAVRNSCNVNYCGCNITPNTLWEKEVLLMRQTFKMPAFDPTHRYRMVVGGAGHTWSGEGMALYINGKMVSEMKTGYYKNGGNARGAFLFENLQEEMAGEEVTVAIKGFLRRSGHKTRSAPPVGHLSAWIQSAKLPPAALALKKTLKD